MITGKQNQRYGEIYQYVIQRKVIPFKSKDYLFYFLYLF